MSVRTVTQLRGRTGRPSPLCLRRPVLPQIGKTRQGLAGLHTWALHLSVIITTNDIHINIDISINTILLCLHRIGKAYPLLSIDITASL